MMTTTRSLARKMIKRLSIQNGRNLLQIRISRRRQNPSRTTQKVSTATVRLGARQLLSGKICASKRSKPRLRSKDQREKKLKESWLRSERRKSCRNVWRGSEKNESSRRKKDYARSKNAYDESRRSETQLQSAKRKR